MVHALLHHVIVVMTHLTILDSAVPAARGAPTVRKEAPEAAVVMTHPTILVTVVQGAPAVRQGAPEVVVLMTHPTILATVAQGAPAAVLGAPAAVPGAPEAAVVMTHPTIPASVADVVLPVRIRETTAIAPFEAACKNDRSGMLPTN